MTQRIASKSRKVIPTIRNAFASIARAKVAPTFKDRRLKRVNRNSWKKELDQ